MVYALSGQIYEAIPSEFTNKETGETVKSVKVTIEQKYVDKDGYRRKDVETISLPHDDLSVLRESLDKYITVYYDAKAYKDNTYLSRNRSIQYVITDTDPLAIASAPAAKKDK